MATSLGANRYNRQNWEDSDFPILCQTCLGDNPYIRMTKEKYGKECKICERPFTIFRWCPGARMRFKKTEICQTCAKLKNICQTCLLDLEYGLPVQLRDHALGLKDDLPKSDVNKEYFTQNMERQIANTDGTVAVGTVGKSERASELLRKMSRAAPYYKRNLPHICSFWVKGECKRGEECPYRHEKPTDADDPLSDQNIKDRYYGVDDPVAEKLMKRVAGNPDINLTPPEDKTVTTLYIGGCGENIEESDLKDYFYQFGEIRSIHIAAKQNCAFVQFSKRSDAEIAASKTGGSLVLKDKRLVIRWGKSQGQRTESLKNSQVKEIELPPVPGLPELPLPTNVPSGEGAQKRPTDGSEPLPPGTYQGLSSKMPMMPPPPFGMPPMGMPPPMSMGMPPNVPPPNFNGPPPPPPGMMPPPPPGIHYPSQDPQRMGTRAMK